MKTIFSRILSRTFISIFIYIALTTLLTVTMVSVRFATVVEDASVALADENSALLMNELSTHVEFANESCWQFVNMIFNDSDVKALLSEPVYNQELNSISIVNRTRKEIASMGIGESVLFYNGITEQYYSTKYIDAQENIDLISFLQTDYSAQTQFLLPRIVVDQENAQASQEFFTYLIVEREVETNNILSAVAMDLKKEQLMTQLSLEREYSNQYLMLIRADGRVLLNAEENFLQTKYFDQDFLSALQKNKNDGFSYDIGAQNCFIVNRFIDSTDWVILNLQEMDVFYAFENHLKMELAITLLFAFLIAVPITFFFAQRIYSPIGRVVQHAKKLAKKQRLESLEPMKNDDLTFLQAVFGAQMQKLNQLEHMQWSDAVQRRKMLVKTAILDSGMISNRDLMSEFSEKYQHNDEMIACYLVLHSFVKECEENQKEWNWLRYAVANITEELMCEYGAVEVIPMTRNVFVVLTKPHTQANDLSVARTICLSIRAQLASVLQLSSSLFIAPTGWNANELRSTYEQLKHLSKYTLLYGTGCVFVADDLQAQEQLSFAYPQALEDELLEHILKCNAEQVSRMLAAFQCAILDGSVQGYVYGITKLLGALQAFTQRLNQNKLEKIELDFTALSRAIEQEETSDAQFAQLQAVVMLLVSKIPYNTEKKNSIICENVKAFIEENYADKALCAKYLSAKFNISTAYLNTMFKSVYGCSVPEYLNTVRLDQAKAKILYSNIAIAKIVDGCGLETSSFYRLYKAKFGVSPKEHRLEEKTKKEVF